MVEGEIMVNLDDYISFAKSYHNELFTLTYNFNVKAIFEDDEVGKHLKAFQDFVV